MRVRVQASARLHLGMLDLNGELGRKFGSLGVAINQPRVVIEASPANDLIVEGLERERTRAFAQRFLDHYGLAGGARILVHEVIPAHVGLGSGTQLALAVGVALARLHGVPAEVAELARVMGRGRRSGVGVATFERGGFVVDAGHRTGPTDEREPSLPPVVFHWPFPDDWRFVVMVPPVQRGLSGEAEDRAFETLMPWPADRVGQICRLLVMGLLPALIEQNIDSFGETLTQIEQLVGEGFAAVQGGEFADPACEELIAYTLKAGAKGAGQTSWGPAVYALAQGEEEAKALEGKVRAFLGDEIEAQIYITRANNRGHTVEVISAGD